MAVYNKSVGISDLLMKVLVNFHQTDLPTFLLPTVLHRAHHLSLNQEHFKIDLFSGHLFVFFNRRRDYVKILAWDNDGLSIWSKRLERGTFEKLTGKADGDFEIDSAELVMMLRGVQIEGTLRRKRYSIDPIKAA